MSAAKHTLGPWALDGNKATWCLTDTEGRRIALIDKHGLNAAPNARLIAAAPELLGCLLAVRDADVDGLAHIDIEAAIAKATGARPALT